MAVDFARLCPHAALCVIGCSRPQCPLPPRLFFLGIEFLQNVEAGFEGVKKPSEFSSCKKRSLP
jgi:hypothetical protein